jgi:ribosomal protein L24E
MSPNNAPATDEEATTCFFCGKEIPSGQWFARLPHESRRVIFCRPRCLELFLQQTGNSTPDWPLSQASEG